MRRAFLRSIGSAAAGVAGLAALTGAASLFSACVGEEDGESTTGKRVTLGTRVALAGGASFTNALGWSLTLSRVMVSSGALYYFDGEPIETTARAPRGAGSGRLAKLVGLGVAHAHPGHYKPGNAKGEMLVAASYDLVLGPVDLAAAEGVSGPFRSARFSFHSPAEGALAAEMGASVAIVEGTAASGTSTKRFRLVAELADVVDPEGNPVVDGCTFAEVDVQQDGVVTLAVDPAVWLDQADLTGVADPTADEYVLVARDDVAHAAFARGLKKATAYLFSFSV